MILYTVLISVLFHWFSEGTGMEHFQKRTFGTCRSWNSYWRWNWSGNCSIFQSCILWQFYLCSETHIRLGNMNLHWKQSCSDFMIGSIPQIYSLFSEFRESYRMRDYQQKIILSGTLCHFFFSFYIGDIRSWNIFFIYQQLNCPY